MRRDGTSRRLLTHTMVCLEFAHLRGNNFDSPTHTVLAAHHEVDFASPNGPNPPVDEGSVEMFKDDESVKFLQDATVTEKLATAKKLSEVNPSQYDAVFYVGGHGPVLDLATDPTNIKVGNEVSTPFIVERARRRLFTNNVQFWRSGKITSAVCHGPA